MINKSELVSQITQAVFDELQRRGVPLGDAGQSDTVKPTVVDEEKRIQNLLEAGVCRLTTGSGIKTCKQELAHLIDHTALKAETTEDAIRKLCEEARQFGFASVCVNPGYVALCKRLLAGSAVRVCTVIGFPLGANTPQTKAYETRDAILNGATEVDMVINVGALKSGNFTLVEADIRAVVEAAKGKATVKVILETGLLNDEEKVKACLICKETGAHFVKTSTGFGPGGATVADIQLMRRIVGDDIGVKASGGVRDFEAARQLVAGGASRIGASAGLKIVGNNSGDSGSGY